MVELRVLIPSVAGSSPASLASFLHLGGAMAAQRPPKPMVEGSSPSRGATLFINGYAAPTARFLAVSSQYP